VSYIRRLGAGLLSRSPVLIPVSVRVGFVVDKVALRQFFLRVLRFTPLSIIPSWLSIPISWGMNMRKFSGRSSETFYQPIDMNMNNKCEVDLVLNCAQRHAVLGFQSYYDTVEVSLSFKSGR
jgi:hypothetical protein